VVALSRLPWIGWLPLLPDEAYYWDWSRRLDLGYFDHPFLAALVIHATTAIGGATPVGVRAGMVLLGLGVVVMAYRLAALLGGRLAGWIALIAAAACPLYALLSLYAAPDGPLLFLWAATVYAVCRAVMTGQGRYWYVAGAMLGLALLSKYVAILLVPSILLFVALFQRGWLRRREPYLAALGALLVFSPNLWWNLRHGWISIRYQLSHGACQGAGSMGERLGAAAIYIGTQIGIVGPLLALLLSMGIIIAVIMGLRDRPHPRFRGAVGASDAGALLLLTCCAVVPSLFFLAVDGLVHWAAPAYFSAIVCLAVVAARLWDRAGRRRRTMLVALGAVTALTTAAESGYLLRAVTTNTRLPSFVGAAVDPTLINPALGWRAVARDVDAVLAGLAPGERRSAVVLADSYGTAAELAFYLDGHPRVYSGSNQYSLWGLPSGAHGPLVLVSNAGTLATISGPLRRGARIARTTTTQAGNQPLRRLEIAVLRPPAGTDPAALGAVLTDAWRVAATGCEGSGR